MSLAGKAVFVTLGTIIGGVLGFYITGEGQIYYKARGLRGLTVQEKRNAHLCSVISAKREHLSARGVDVSGVPDHGARTNPQ